MKIRQGLSALTLHKLQILLFGVDREFASRFCYLQHYRSQQLPVTGIHQRDLHPAGIAVTQLKIPVARLNREIARPGS